MKMKTAANIKNTPAKNANAFRLSGVVYGNSMVASVGNVFVSGDGRETVSDGTCHNNRNK